MLPAFSPLSAEVAPIEHIADVTTDMIKQNLEPARENLEQVSEEVRQQKKSPIDLLIAAQTYELISSSFDSTGAYREEIFHVQLQKYMRERQIALDENGLLKTSPDDEKTYWLAATLPDLPYVNLKGTHEAGDFTLGSMSSAFEHGLATIAVTDDIPHVAHMRGGDFNLFNIKTDANSIEQVKKEIENAALPPVYKTSYSPKITVSAVSMEEVVELFNSAQIVRGLEDPGTMVLDEQQIQKELSGILARILDYERERDKVNYLGNKIVLDIAQGTQSSKELEEYFNKYALRYFEGSQYPSYESFKDLVQTDSEQAANVVSKLAQRAADIAVVRGSVESGNSSHALEQFIAKKYSHLELDTLPGATNSQEVSLTQQSSSNLQQQLSEKIAAAGGLSKLLENSAQPTNIENVTQTYHATKNQQVKAIVEEAKKEFDDLVPGPLDENQVEILKALLEYSDLNHTIDVLGIKYNFYDSINELLHKRGLTAQDIEDLRKFVELHEWRLKVFEARHDKLTGLGNKFEFERETNDLVAKALKNRNEDVGVFFVDLAFLNYFNQKGNRLTGNAAIVRSVRQLEEEFKKLYGDYWEEEVQIKRYGGDELVIQHLGKHPTSQQIKDVLDKLNATGKPVEAVGGNSPDYVPERVQYNYGFCDIKLAKEGLQELIKNGKVFNAYDTARLADPREKEFYAQNLSKVMTNMADLLGDAHKISERFAFLMQRYVGLKESGTEDEWTHFNHLLAFSGKALMGISLSDFEAIYKQAQQSETPDYAELFKTRISGKELTTKGDVVAVLIKNREEAASYRRSVSSIV
ncbi:MAG TPA: GGDEF domain-containing protein [Candidatus Saccharimonadales bacterium]|nr:GGDEF domain-containing protein [Candidatus Saccharimonadales bacterium]